VSVNPPPQRYAGIVSRGVAFVIDAVLIDTALIVIAACIALVFSVLVPDDFDPGIAGVVAGLGTWGLVSAAYFIGFWTLTGQTAGMRAMRLRVTDASGNRLRPARALIRLVGMWVAAVPLMAGYALILFDGRRQGLHDKLAGTLVCHVAGVHAPMAAHPRAPLSSGPLPHETARDLSIDAEERLA
jgi:uncharacterized RDD family membrane protein YckC